MATAAPLTPISRAKIKIGSRTMFTTAEEIITNIGSMAFPSALTVWFIIIIKNNSTAPPAMTDMYSAVGSMISAVAPNKASRGRRKKTPARAAARPKKSPRRITCPAVREAVSLFPAPREREIKEAAPTPVPMAMAPKSIWIGIATERAAMAALPNRDTKKVSARL